MDVVGQGLRRERRQRRGGKLILPVGDAAVGAIGPTNADAVVEVIVGIVVGNNGVGVIVTAVEEYADQGLVIGGGEGCGLAEGGEVHGQRRGCAQGTKGGGTL